MYCMPHMCICVYIIYFYYYIPAIYSHILHIMQFSRALLYDFRLQLIDSKYRDGTINL